MPAYLLVTARVTDPAAMQAYQTALTESGLYQRYGGRTLFRGRAAEPLEDWTGEGLVCAEFPDRQAAHAFWHDPDYERVKALRVGAGHFHVAIFEGL